jgi:putative transposase
MNYRRYRVEGATYFFTVVTDSRVPFLCGDTARVLLHRVFAECRARWPFTIDAIVLLPDHLHTIWTLPEADASYSRRWGWLKKEFTKGWLEAGNAEQPVSAGRERKRYRGVFQPRFWEHLIRDEDDFIRHADYIHFNPVKHGYAKSAWDWEWSSFRQQVSKGWYPQDWAAAGDDYADIAEQAGE